MQTKPNPKSTLLVSVPQKQRKKYSAFANNKFF